MNQIVRFKTNVPEEITLRSLDGKRVEGRYGDQVMYQLRDDRVMYVPPYVEQRFQELAIGPDEPVLLCRREVKQGERTRIEWSVKRAPQRSSASAIGIADLVTDETTTTGGNEKEDEMRDGTEAIANGTAKQEEQPSCPSTAPMAQEFDQVTKAQHQGQNSAEGPGNEIVLAPARSAELATSESVYLPAMTMEVALARRAAIVEFTRRIMVRDQDFGQIPGASKPTLLKPGAEKLCNFFGLEPEFTPIVEEIDWTGAQHGSEVFCYSRYRCRLLREGRVVGVGEGSCNSWEAKYRYRWVAEEQVPEHLDRTRLVKHSVRRTLCEFEFAIDRGETTGAYGKPAAHWQMFRDAIRNGTARQVEKFTRRGNSVAWEIDIDTTVYRVPNPDVADVVNTIQKMAQKRALVSATLIATSASEFFTQDVEDVGVLETKMDTGSHPYGTREAQEYVRDRKLEELRSRRGAADGDQNGFAQPETVKPWRNFGEMRRVFEQMREQVGETRYMEELELAGVETPGQFRSTNQAFECYRRLAHLAAQPEVA